VFVLLVDAAKGDYYFVPNVDRGILARHINEQVRVDGVVNEKMKSIKADSLLYDGFQKCLEKGSGVRTSKIRFIRTFLDRAAAEGR